MAVPYSCGQAVPDFSLRISCHLRYGPAVLNAHKATKNRLGGGSSRRVIWTRLAFFCLTAVPIQSGLHGGIEPLLSGLST